MKISIVLTFVGPPAGEHVGIVVFLLKFIIYDFVRVKRLHIFILAFKIYHVHLYNWLITY